MALAIYISVAVAIFVFGNAYRILRIALLPAHLRWELYPIPRGTAEQQRYGGSYFEEAEWWTKRRTSSWASELVYIAREVLTFTTLRQRNRPLWLWSWLMHVGLYGFVAATVMMVAAITIGTPASFISPIVLVSSCAGLAGVAGVAVRRFGTASLRTYTTRTDTLNLFSVAAIFVSAIAVHTSAEAAGAATSFARAIFTMGIPPVLPWPAAVHIVVVGIFLAYFPATHMTHAYMKFFTFHRVRWDDVPVVHDAAMNKAMNANVRRPISWAAPHIASGEKSTWADAVARAGRRP